MVSLLILLKHHFIPKMYKRWLFKYFKIAFRKRHREDGLRIFHRAAEEKKRGPGNGVTGRDCNLKIVPSSFWPWPKKWTTRNRPVNFVLFFFILKGICNWRWTGNTKMCVLEWTFWKNSKVSYCGWQNGNFTCLCSGAHFICRIHRIW